MEWNNSSPELKRKETAKAKKQKKARCQNQE